MQHGPAFLALVAFIVVISLPLPQYGGAGDRPSWVDFPLAAAAAGISLYLLRVLRRRVHRARRLADRAGLHDGRAGDHHGDGGHAAHDGAAAAGDRHGVPAVRAARPLHARHPRPPRLFGAARGQPHLRRHRGHLRHRRRRGRDVRLPLRAVRHPRADDGPRPAVHGPRDHRRRPLFRRSGQGLRRVVGHVRHDLGLGHRQRGDDRLADDPADEEVRLLAALRRRGRGVGVLRRAGDAAGNGRIGVRDGGAPRRALQAAGAGRHRAGAVPLLRLPDDGPPRGQAAEALRRRGAPHPEAVARSSARAGTSCSR